MTLPEAIAILEYHQEWRKGEFFNLKYTPAEITKAIDVILKHLKKEQP